MKGLWFFVILTLFSVPACSRLRSPAAAPPAASSDLARSELDRLQGSWRIESSLWNGVADPEIMKSVTIVIQGDNFIWVDRDGKRRTDTIRLMPEQNPRQLSAGEERELDGLLQKVDQLMILKTRARYTLDQERPATAST